MTFIPYGPRFSVGPFFLAADLRSIALRVHAVHFPFERHVVAILSPRSTSSASKKGRSPSGSSGSLLQRTRPPRVGLEAVDGTGALRKRDLPE